MTQIPEHLGFFISGGPSAYGEANIGANVGAGAGLVYRDKTGVTLNFRTLLAGSGVAVATIGDEVVISVAGYHSRQHAMTSPTDHAATAWRVFHSNSGGQVVELPLGAAGQVLASQGPTAAPIWIDGGWVSEDLDETYHAEAAGDHIVTVDEGPVIWRLADGESFRVDIGAAGTPVSLPDGDCEAVGMAAWTIVGSPNKDTVYPHSGLQCIEIQPGESIAQNVLTIGVEVTVGFWARTAGGTEYISVVNNTITVVGTATVTNTYQYFEFTFTPVGTDLKFYTQGAG